MEYLKLLYELPAIMAGVTVVCNLAPVTVDKRLIPALVFAMALVVLQVPEYVDLSLALTLPAGMLLAFIGIRLTEHEPIKYHVPKHRKRKAPDQTFADRPYERPGTETEPQDDEEEIPPEQEAGETLSVVRSFVPKL